MPLPPRLPPPLLQATLHPTGLCRLRLAPSPGGPLLDSRGRLIGINTAIADPTGKGASSGIGFAIPIDTGAELLLHSP